MSYCSYVNNGKLNYYHKNYHDNIYGFPAKNDKELRERLDYEIGIMERMGFVSYFLITWDFIKWAKDNKIPVGPGRGSAAGSIVAYVLGITDLDPCLLYTSPSPRDRQKSRMPSSA